MRGSLLTLKHALGLVTLEGATFEESCASTCAVLRYAWSRVMCWDARARDALWRVMHCRVHAVSDVVVLLLPAFVCACVGVQAAVHKILLSHLLREAGSCTSMCAVACAHVQVRSYMRAWTGMHAA
eukprot:361743-Chlamydomonas_euryale.AAC.4